MSKISNIINGVSEFAKTDAGKVAINGAASIGIMALDSLITKKYASEKATFGRALGLGICAVAAQTLLGSAVAAEQEQRANNMEKAHEAYREENVQELTQLHCKIRWLQQELQDAREEAGRLRFSEMILGSDLQDAERENEELRRRNKAIKADLDGTTRGFERLLKENEALKAEIEMLRVEKLKRDSASNPNLRAIIDSLYNTH